MNFQPPMRLKNKLSRHSVLALFGLTLFAVFVLAANPFGEHTTSASVPASNQQSSHTISQSSGATQGSLLTTPPPSHNGGSDDDHNDDSSGDS